MYIKLLHKSASIAPCTSILPTRRRHYIDIERREEGFDRSGPLDPLGHFSSAKGVGLKLLGMESSVGEAYYICACVYLCDACR